MSRKPTYKGLKKDYGIGTKDCKAARYLGVGRATLYRFLKNFPDITLNIYESE